MKKATGFNPMDEAAKELIESQGKPGKGSVSTKS